MSTNMRGKVAVVGVGETTIEKGKIYNNYWQVTTEPAIKAIADAGLTKKDIDGVILARSLPQGQGQILDFSTTLVEYMGLRPGYCNSVVIGGMCANTTVYKAALAIEAGLANYVLITRGGNMLSRLKRQGMVEALITLIDAQWEQPFGLFIPAWFAMLAKRHMHQYGTTSEQMAAVAVAARKHASLNPNAQNRDPITIQDVLNSKMIADPIHILDMSLLSDGGGALIVTSAERAKDLPHPPVYLLGFGDSSGPHHSFLEQKDLMDFESLRRASQAAFKMAKVTPADIDVAFPYDASTIMTIIDLETMGFCKKGEGGAFVEGGHVELGGKLPINTHGGLLSYRHYTMTQSSSMEAVRQLRGECGARQVKGAELAVVQHEGGSPYAHNCVLVFGRSV